MATIKCRRAAADLKKAGKALTKAARRHKKALRRTQVTCRKDIRPPRRSLLAEAGLV